METTLTYRGIKDKKEEVITEVFDILDDNYDSTIDDAINEVDGYITKEEFVKYLSSNLTLPANKDAILSTFKYDMDEYINTAEYKISIEEGFDDTYEAWLMDYDVLDDFDKNEFKEEVLNY